MVFLGRRMMSRIGPKRHRRAFTLMELLIVCVIIGLLMCGSVPAFRDAFRGASMRRASGDICAVMRQARALAVAQEWGFIVRFEKEESRYRLVRVSHPSDPAGGGNDDVWSERRLPKDVVFDEISLSSTGKGYAAVFYPDGTAEEGEIVLKPASSSREESVEVRIEGATGRVGMGAKK